MDKEKLKEDDRHNLTKQFSGGFPPIYLCTLEQKKKLIEQEEKKKVSYETIETSVDIKSIMEARRVNPFI